MSHFLKQRFCLVMTVFVIMVASPVWADTQATSEVVLQHDMNRLAHWRVISGSKPVEANLDEVASSPVMRLNNGLVASSLERAIPQGVDWALQFEALPTEFKRSGWVGVFDAEHAHGFAVRINSATDQNFNGMGGLMLHRIDVDEPLVDWQQARKAGGELLDRAPHTGHVGRAESDVAPILTPPLIALSLTYQATSGLLTLRSEGQVVAETLVEPFDEAIEFSDVVACGNTSLFFDNIKVTAMLPPLPRASEVQALAPNAEVSVKDFGAVGDGEHNDAPAFAEALASLSEIEGLKVLHVPAGEYYLKPEEGSNESRTTGHLHIQGFKDLRVQGEPGTLLLLGSAFHHGVYVGSSDNVRLESLAVDYQPVPYSQGTIIEASPDDHSFVFKLQDGFPKPTADHIQAPRTKHIAYLFEPDSGLKANQFYDQYIEKIEQLDETHARLTSRNPVTPEFVGKTVAMVGRRKADAIVFESSQHCVADHVTVYSAPALGFGLRNCDYITIQNSKIQQRPGTGRMMSSVADGIHVKWGEHGPKILNNWLEGMGDDSVNIGGTYQRIMAQPAPNTLIVERHGSLIRGNQIVLVDNRTGHMKPLGNRTKTESVTWEGQPAMRLTFENDLDPIERTTANSDPEHTDLVINMDQVASGAVIRNNFFGRHRMRGILMRGHNSIIEGNRFEDLLGPAIKLGHHYGGRKEGPNGSHTIIRNNTFVNIGRSVINVKDSGPKPEDGQVARSIEDVQIIDNRFIGYGKPSAHGHGSTGNVMFIDNVEGVLIDRNWIDAAHPDSPSEPLIVVDRAADVFIRGTHLMGLFGEPGAYVEVTNRADAPSVTLEP